MLPTAHAPSAPPSRRHAFQPLKVKRPLLSRVFSLLVAAISALVGDHELGRCQEGPHILRTVEEAVAPLCRPLAGCEDLPQVVDQPACASLGREVGSAMLGARRAAEVEVVSTRWGEPTEPVGR